MTPSFTKQQRFCTAAASPDLDIAKELGYIEEAARNNRKVPVGQVNALLSQCKRENQVEIAETVYELGKANISELERSFYSAMMNVYVQAKRMDDALRIYEEMLEQGFTTDIRVFNILLQGYSMERDGTKLEQIEDAITELGLEMDEFTYSILLQGYTSTNRLERAEHIFSKWRRETAEHTRPNYLTMFRAYAHKQKVDSALQVISLMIERDLAPTVDMYNDIISGAAKSANHSVAWRCFLDMQKLHLQPDVHSWNGLIEALVKARLVDSAITQFKQMRLKGTLPNQRTFHLLVMGLVKEKRANDAEAMFIAMRNAKVEVDPWTWKYIIECFARSRQLPKAFLLTDQMLVENVKAVRPLINILETQCERAGEMKWFESRFGAARKTHDKDMADKIMSEWQREGHHIWEVEGEPFSLMSLEEQKNKKRDEDFSARIKALEAKFLETVPEQYREEMLDNREKLAAKRRSDMTAKAGGANLEGTRWSGKPKEIKKKKPTFAKEDPFTELEKLRSRKQKKLNTPKDTRRPKSQFSMGRNRGPKA
eukprot:TRINITY_DN9994_c0_g1_i1.p1 TRINITY_DN9994_c0_g1~~TRINITY_DN9994_c0_g1_i1.p1  ORF type:complete len:567 (-),score=140.11 TRINITY_DN9994_c0_g1_i1:30-1649(-)